MQYLMLHLIVWSLLEQYAGLISSECTKCKMDSVTSQLVPISWTDGQCSENQPRLLHCVHSNVILVSRIYHCPNQHRVFGHHPDVINLFTRTSLQCLVPFRLWHVTGFTLTLVDYVDCTCQSGIPMQQIERILVSNCA